MKIIKIIKNLLVFLGLMIAFIYASWIECHYTRDCVVVKVEKNEVMVEDNNNNYWKFIGDGYKVGQVVRLTFYTNHTDNDIIDDEIVEVR